MFEEAFISLGTAIDEYKKLNASWILHTTTSIKEDSRTIWIYFHLKWDKNVIYRVNKLESLDVKWKLLFSINGEYNVIWRNEWKRVILTKWKEKRAS
jgi:hypothetical protein